MAQEVTGSRVGSKNPAPAGSRGAGCHYKTHPAPPSRFSKATIREGYSGAERRKKILRYFCLREARGGAVRVFSPRDGAAEFFLPKLPTLVMREAFFQHHLHPWSMSQWS